VILGMEVSRSGLVSVVAKRSKVPAHDTQSHSTHTHTHTSLHSNAIGSLANLMQESRTNY